MTESGDPDDAQGDAFLGGVIRRVPEDFRVEEIPLYRPTGRGDYVLCQIEKRGLSTFDAVLRISKGAKVSELSIGYAGLKDTRAVTRQWLSVKKVSPERVLAVRHPRLRVLTAARHGAALKVGHHRGNRFTIRIRDVRRDRIPAARETLERIVRDGLPNAYGSQRFGVRQDGHRLGRALVEEDWAEFVAQLLGRPSRLEQNPRVIRAREAYDRGDVEGCRDLFPLKHRAEKKAASVLLRTQSPREAFLALGKRSRRIWVAAWQSYVFNRVLEARIAAGTWNRLLPGDLAAEAESGACFPVGDAPPTRLAWPTGPLVGHDLPETRGEPGRLEAEAFRAEGIRPEAFRADHVRARGSRRPFVVPVREAGLEDLRDGSVLVRFVLPPGAFATVLLERLVGTPL